MGRKHAFTALLSAILCAATLTAQTQDKPMPMGGTGHDMGNMPMGQDMGGMKMGGMNKPATPGGPLKITFGDKSAMFTAAELAAMPQTSVTVNDAHAKADITYTGVPVLELLAKVGVAAKMDSKSLSMYLVVEGADGYKVTYSLGEVAPEYHDAIVIVADTENGKPLTGDGPLKLIGSREKHPSRWVRNLTAIKVMTAD